MQQNLILLHGALGSKATFNAIKKGLSSKFNVHSLDFDGHGHKPASAGYSMELFANNVKQYMAQNDLAKSHFFGYSMGGYVALVLALKHPNLVGNICTLGTKFTWNPTIAAKETSMLNPDKIAEKVPAFAKHLNNIHSANNWKDVLNNTATMMTNLGDGAGLTTANYKQIKHNITIGIGSKDNMVSIEESQHAATLLPNGKLVILENVLHPIAKIDDYILQNYIEELLADK